MPISEKHSSAEQEKTQKKERRPKVQFDLTPEAEEELDELQRLSSSTTRVDTIRRALLFYGWFIHDVDPDSVLQVVKDGKVITSFPASLLKGTKRPGQPKEL
jgi:hypothetical protein